MSRRSFVANTAVVATGLGFGGLLARAFGVEETKSQKPNSKFSGVQIGINAPYSFGNRTMPGDETLSRCVELGLSGVELRAQPVELYLGAPRTKPEELPAWRKSVSFEKVAEFRKKYETAGVMIEIMKVDDVFKLSDDELDYFFKLGKALGARALSTEISTKDDELKRVGGFADKHQMLIGYHGHTKVGPKQWERAFELAKFNGANVDIGHFIAGNNVSPVPFIEKYHERVTHVHIKDRKFQEGPNVPFGQGDTPIVEVLRLIRDNHWNIQATIEFEYKVPEGSDRMKEIARCIEYCRKALESDKK